MKYIEEFDTDELEDMFSDKDKHEQFKERLAEKLAENKAPCQNYGFVDEVATFCDQECCYDLCNPTECWLRVFEQVEKQNERTDKEQRKS